MKEIFYFLKWAGHKTIASIKSWDFWMWMWMATCFFASSWANADKGGTWELICKYVLLTIIIGYWFAYALVYGGVKKAWKSYQEEKQKVINILGERNEFSTNGR